MLLAGVIGRYVFHSPLIWSDELASILFLWLAMLGAVVALPPRRAHAHDGGRRHAAPPMRAFLDVVAVAAALAFLLLDHHAGLSSSPQEEAFITTPALEIPNSWRAAALPVGIGLMIAHRRCSG